MVARSEEIGSMEPMVKVLRYWQELATVHTSKPTWRLPNRELYRNCSFTLRLFHEGEGTPIFVLPPNAGHHSSVAERLIETCISVVPQAPVYSFDWSSAQNCNDSKFDTISSLQDYVARSVDLAGKPVHLIGLCQGGWLGAIYTALHPQNIRALMLAAAPIDFHAAVNESKIQGFVKCLPQEWYTSMVHLGGGVWPGELQLTGFRNLNPYDRYIGDYLELWQAIMNEDEKAIAKWRNNHIWYDNPLNIAGVWFLQAVDLLFRQNLLVKKKLKVSGEIVDLSKITCPVYMLAGENDDITHRDELFNLEKYVSSSKVEKYVVPDCGHIGVFVREKSQQYWQKILKEAYSDDPMEKLIDKLKL